MSEPTEQAVPLSSIFEPADQHRELIAPEALGTLADSIAAEGLHQAIGVRTLPDRPGFEIIFGHRRFLAVKLLRHATIRARVYPADTDVLLVRASENLNREQLNPMEEAHIVQLYIDAGHSRAETARKCRRSLFWVDTRVDLLQLPPDVQDAIRVNGLAIGVAKQLADVDHEPYRRQLLYEAVTHGCTANVAASWRQHYLTDRERIVHNNVAIEAIIQDRNKYVLTYPCDWCEEGVAYQDTRTLRLCIPCMEQLDQAKRDAAATRSDGAHA